MFDKKKYRKKYRENLKAQGKCGDCRKDVVPGKTYCQKCLNKRNKQHKKRKAQGKCQRCEKKSIPGKSCCQKCSDKRNKRNKNLIKLGKCQCGRDAVFGKKCCQNCSWKGILRKHNLLNKQATQILEKQNYICPLSGRKLIKGINASCDHIICKCNGGTNNIKNLRFVDIHAQYARLDYSDKELYRLSKDIYFNLRGKYK